MARLWHKARNEKGPAYANPFILLVRPERFERPTPWFVAKYSIQLSYGRALTIYPGWRLWLAADPSMNCESRNDCVVDIEEHAVGSRYGSDSRNSPLFKAAHHIRESRIMEQGGQKHPPPGSSFADRMLLVQRLPEIIHTIDPRRSIRSPAPNKKARPCGMAFVRSSRRLLQVQSSPPEMSAILELSSHELLSAIPKSWPPMLSG
jgi:hypothetical protein